MRTKLLFAAISCLGLPLYGQTLGEITGRVSDASGAGVPGATMTLTSTATNAVRNTEAARDFILSHPCRRAPTA